MLLSCRSYESHSFASLTISRRNGVFWCFTNSRDTLIHATLLSHTTRLFIAWSRVTDNFSLYREFPSLRTLNKSKSTVFSLSLYQKRYLDSPSALLLLIWNAALKSWHWAVFWFSCLGSVRDISCKNAYLFIRGYQGTDWTLRKIFFFPAARVVLTVYNPFFTW